MDDFGSLFHVRLASWWSGQNNPRGRWCRCLSRLCRPWPGSIWNGPAALRSEERWRFPGEICTQRTKNGGKSMGKSWENHRTILEKWWWSWKSSGLFHKFEGKHPAIAHTCEYLAALQACEEKVIRASAGWRYVFLDWGCSWGSWD